VRETVIVFDDILAFGKHFRVASTRIRDVLPHQPIIGVFIARAMHLSALTPSSSGGLGNGRLRVGAHIPTKTMGVDLENTECPIGRG
jgi:hypothetical protein